jgi:predicted ATPase
MLTRLRIKGFKNLSDVEVNFGPFTCIAGANAVGKSNLFDAIRFLSLLADMKLDEAARSIRAEDGRNGDVRSLFTNNGYEVAQEMEFDLDMIVPREAVDELGQAGEASITCLNYKLRIGYRDSSDDRRQLGELELLFEELNYITHNEARKRLRFHPAKAWLDSVITGRKTSKLISTLPEDGKTFVVLHQDGTSRTGFNKRGPGYKRVARQLPRTVLSAGDADSPTVLCARVELRSWELLQLEPSAMRESDSINQSTGVDASGAHMAATLYELGRTPVFPGKPADPEAAYQRVSNRLSELLGDVRGVGVDVDEKRELLSLYLMDRMGVRTQARSLSDGTLSFIALVIKQMESRGNRLLCMEEPENGIHPRRIPAILDLLQDIAVDVSFEVDDANPLRQVIVNTHSPSVVQQVPEDSILFAETAPSWTQGSKTFERLVFRVLPATWRSANNEEAIVVKKASLLAYLRVPSRQSHDEDDSADSHRVIDSSFVQGLLNL